MMVKPTKLVVVYVDGTAHLAWRVGVKIRDPYETRAVYVDATVTATSSRRAKAVTMASSGHVQFKVERLCAGDKPEVVNMPNIQWTERAAYQLQGRFQVRAKDIDPDKCSTAQPMGENHRMKVVNWLAPGKFRLVASPADNDVEITDAPLGPGRSLLPCA